MTLTTTQTAQTQLTPPTWKLFSNPTRNTIIDLLDDTPRTTGELCEYFELSRFAIMQHLKVLERAEIITAEKRGRHRWNHLNRQKLEQLKAADAKNSGVKKRSVPKPEIDITFDFNVAPHRLFTALTHDIGLWWSDAPRSAGTDFPTMRLEAKLGGRFYNCLDHQENGVLYGTIDQLKTDELLGITGNMGSDSAISVIRLRLLPFGTDITRLHLRHTFIGELDTTAYEAFQQSWQQLLAIRLKFFIEKN